MHGVILDRDSFDAGDLDLSRLEASLPNAKSYSASKPEDVPARIADAEVVITNKVIIDTQGFEAARRLRLIAVAATGTNNVNLKAAREHAVTVCNVRSYATPAVAQHTFALILALTTRLVEYRDAVHAGRWQQSPHFCLLNYPIRELSGRTLGIIGYGTLGRGVARIAEGFDMRVLIANRPNTSPTPGRTALDEILRAADVLTLHCPLTSATEGLIGKAQLAMMKNDAILINTARGGIVDEHALVQALRTGKIGGAGVDVLTTEPPAAGNPLLDPTIPNLIVTPHNAWASRETRQRLVDEIAVNIQAFNNGTPRNVCA